MPEVVTWRVKSLYKLAIVSQTTIALFQTKRCVLTVNSTIGGSYEVSLRRAGKQHHLGIGRAHASKSVFLIIDAKTVTVTDQKQEKYSANTQSNPRKATGPKTDRRTKNHQHENPHRGSICQLCRDTSHWYPRWDLNPHWHDFKSCASNRLGYGGMPCVSCHYPDRKI